MVTATWSRTTARGDELAAALRHLGAGEPLFLGYADARVPGSAPGAPRLLDAPLDRAVERLVSIVREFKPVVAVTHDPYGNATGHPDLETYRITPLAVETAALEDAYPNSGIRPRSWEMLRPQWLAGSRANPVSGSLRLGNEQPEIAKIREYDVAGRSKCATIGGCNPRLPRRL